MTVWYDVRWQIDDRQSLVLCGLLSLPALHGLIRRPPLSRLSWPVTLGRYAMVIYLFNTLAIGAAKAVLIRAGVPIGGEISRCTWRSPWRRAWSCRCC